MLARDATPRVRCRWARPRRRRIRSATSSRAIDVADLLEQDRELVAATVDRPCRPVGATVTRRDDLDQQLVPGAVAQGVVHVLEVIEIHEQHRRPRAMATAPGEGVLDAVGEERPIGQSGQRVVERLMAQLGLEVRPVGDIVAVDDETADRRLVGEVPRGPFEHAPPAVLVGHACFALDIGARPVGDRGQLLDQDLAVVRVDGMGQLSTHEVVGREAEDPVDGHAHVADRAVVVDDEHEIRRVLGERAEPRLAVAHAVGQFAQAAVLAAQPAGCAFEPDQQDRGKDECHGSGDEKDVPACLRDARLDRAGVLVHLVGRDHIAAGRSDGQVDLEELGGQAVLELVLRGGPVRELARDLAVEGFFEVLLDLEPATAELRQVGEDDGAVRAPDLDAQEAAGLDELPEGLVDPSAGRAVRVVEGARCEQRVDEAADDGRCAPCRLGRRGGSNVLGDGLRGDGRRCQHKPERHGNEDESSAGAVGRSQPSDDVGPMARTGFAQVRTP